MFLNFFCVPKDLYNEYIKLQTSPSFMLASASVSIGQLEHQLILSMDPWRIRQILIELHGMTSERQFWTVSCKVMYFTTAERTQ